MYFKITFYILYNHILNIMMIILNRYEPDWHQIP